MLTVLTLASVRGADLEEGQKAYLTGNYDGCIAMAREALKERRNAETWPFLLTKSLLATGRYAEANAAISNALSKDRWDVRLQWLAREVYLANGQVDAANAMVDRLIRAVSADPSDYRDALSLVAFGRAALVRGADPKRVLDTIYATAKKADPKSREVYLAIGELALEKHDYALAGSRFQEGLKELPDDPDLHFGLARAYTSGDHALMVASLEATLSRNSNHVGSLLLLADYSINAEDYPGAERYLDQVQTVNPWHPEAWAYRAVIAHLRNQPEAEQSAREKALKFWPNNPAVDHLIGRKLSQNYRFAEGADYQREALTFDPRFLPAKAQLAQDLLRLGEETEGWLLADQVQKQDAYDVEAYNLATLHDSMASFVTLSNRFFQVRMRTNEAGIYGTRVINLLERARSNLCAKYGFEPLKPVIVEVFPEQKDFAVRTFGMPGNLGYLGVCFGNVVTANSPAAHPGHPVNWEAVLWHEFCHVVTLGLTHNKMPRWLSEGISVYEELQANPAWGQRMNPNYREMVLGDELAPVSKMSAAFLSPRSEEHLQFAYYQASLVVEFLVDRFGTERLKAVLRDLGKGVEINAALQANTVPMAELEKAFALFAKGKAEGFAPGLDWEKPDFEPGKAEAARPSGKERRPVLPRPDSNDRAWRIWAATRPTNYYAMKITAEEHLQQRHWKEAKEILEPLVRLYPGQTGEESAYWLLAKAHRELNETNAEFEVLGRFAERDDESTAAYQRLMELGAAFENWQCVATNAQRYIAVNPLVALPHRYLATAGEKLGEARTAADGYEALLRLTPADPSEVHYRLARALHQLGDPRALREVLKSLEDAPRYSEALRLLVEIKTERKAAAAEAGGDS